MIVQPLILVSPFSVVSPDLISDLDNRIRLDFQWLDDRFFWWVMVSALIVVIGCALEGPELFHELWPNAFAVFSGRWVKKVGLIGWLLIVLGVAGEGVFEVLEYQAQGLLQTFNEVILTTTQRQTADAYERAAYAREEADSFQSQIADSAARVKEAEAKVASAEAAQQNVEVELNKQKAMAATAEADLIKLQQRLSWRVIGAAQREKLVQHLMDGPKGTIEIEYPGDDQEALHFAGLLRDVFKDARWPLIKRGEPQAMIADSNTGLGVIAHRPEDTPAYAGFLQRTLTSDGIPCNGLYSEKRSPGDVILSVGHRDTGP